MKELLFKTFQWASRVTRGSGIGRVPLFRSVRDGLYSAIRPEGRVQVAVQGFRMKVDARTDGLKKELLTHGTYEHATTEYIKTRLGEGEIFIDCGAHVGYFTLLAAVRGARVIAFEPHPDNFRELSENCVLNADLFKPDTRPSLHAAGVSSRSHRAGLGWSDGDVGWFYMAKGWNVAGGGDVADIDFVSIDSLNLSDVRLIKLDVEGHEPDVLLGMAETLKRSPRIAVLTEYSPSNLTRGGHDPESYIRSYRDLGFQRIAIGRHVPGKYEPIDWSGLPALGSGEWCELLIER